MKYEIGSILCYTDRNGDLAICYFAMARKVKRTIYYWTTVAKYKEHGSLSVGWRHYLSEQKQTSLDIDIWSEIDPLAVLVRHGTTPEEIVSRHDFGDFLVGMTKEVAEKKKALRRAMKDEIKARQVVEQLKGLNNVFQKDTTDSS